MELFAVLLTVALLFFISRAVRGHGGVRDSSDAFEKVQMTIDLCRDNLDPTKLARGNESYTHYYIGYQYEVAKAVSRAERVEFTKAFQIPVYLEASRLCGSGKDDFIEGEGLLGDILVSEYGRRGLEDGKDDGALAVDSAYGGPYWERIKDVFRGLIAFALLAAQAPRRLVNQPACRARPCFWSTPGLSAQASGRRGR